GNLGERINDGPAGDMAFVLAPPRRRDPCLLGNAVGHAMKPAGERSPRLQGSGLPAQDQEGGLECVLRVLVVPQNPPAQAKNPGTVAADQQRKGRLVTPGEETVQQLAIGQAESGLLPADLPKVLKNRARLAFRHRPGSPGPRSPLPVQFPGKGKTA